MDDGVKRYIIISNQKFFDSTTHKVVGTREIKVDKKFYDFCKNFKKGIDKSKDL